MHIAHRMAEAATISEAHTNRRSKREREKKKNEIFMKQRHDLNGGGMCADGGEKENEDRIGLTRVLSYYRF